MSFSQEPRHGQLYQSNKAEGNEKNDGKDAPKQHIPSDASFNDRITWIGRIEVTDHSHPGRKAIDYRLLPSRAACRACRKVVSARAI